MRAARQAAPACLWPRRSRGQGSLAAASPEQQTTPRPQTGGLPAAVWGLAGLFLAGYAAAVFCCRRTVPEFGQTLAKFYMDKQNFAAFGQVFAALFAAAFLQLTAVAACGSSVVGPAGLALLFAAKGVVLGACAAAVYLDAGARGLVIYWLLSSLQELAQLLLLLWLACAASSLSLALLRTLLGGSPVRGALKIKTKLLGARYGAALLVSAGCAALGAASAVLFAGVLL